LAGADEGIGGAHNRQGVRKYRETPVNVEPPQIVGAAPGQPLNRMVSRSLRLASQRQALGRL